LIFPYSIRLICLCLEMIFLVNLTVSILVLVLSWLFFKAARRMRAKQAASLFFGLRLLPFGLSVLVVATLCIPSYLRYEQNTGSEGMGLFCLSTAWMGLALVLSALVRGGGALGQLRRISVALRGMQTSCVAETEICVADERRFGAPLMALVGVLRPRLLVSPQLLQALSTQQLEAALLHERGHQLSQDNLKRLLMAVTPCVLPFVNVLATIERRWERFAELAADDYATEGRADRSIALAEALVHVARLSHFERRIPLASSLSAVNRDLALRVDRLLSMDAKLPQKGNRPLFAGKSLIPMILTIVLLAILSNFFHPLYELLESLLH
jgi:hypothetical protein